jgi:hypothetical protein
MSTVVLSDARVLLAHYDISGKCNRGRVVRGSKSLNDTTFGPVPMETSKAGLLRAKIELEGFTDFGPGSLDDVMVGSAGGTNLVGMVDVPVLASPKGAYEGDVAYFMRAHIADYDHPGIDIGELFKFRMKSEASGRGASLVRGRVFEDGRTARTTSGNSAAQQLGAVASGQRLFAVVHLLEFTGASLGILVRSAVTNFATITTRMTFSPETPIALWGTPVNGPITDTWYRIEWSGTFSSFKAVVAVGIQ